MTKTITSFHKTITFMIKKRVIIFDYSSFVFINFLMLNQSEIYGFHFEK